MALKLLLLCGLLSAAGAIQVSAVFGPADEDSDTDATASAAVAPPSEGQRIAATGDPHLENIFGQRFDLMRPGRYTLIQVPKDAGAEETLLRAEADAVRIGTGCADMYFTAVNFTGAWAEARQDGGIQFIANQPDDSRWVSLGKIDLKVAQGKTLQGVGYLNIYVKHLSRTGLEIGGLLGSGDHTEASTPDASCQQGKLALEGSTDAVVKPDQLDDKSAPTGSRAQASLQ